MPRRRTRLPALLLFLFLLSGCSLLQQEPEWPVEAPPKDHYLQYYREDAVNQQRQSLDDYLMWVSRFYTGLNLVPGWNAITARVMQKVPEEERVEVTYRMRALGRNISSEWAKDNQARLINSRLVNVWRDAFIEAENTGDLMNYLTRLEDDVTSLLDGSLKPDEIYFERYYKDSFAF